MNYKEAREYLQPVADTCVLPQYAEALEMALEALQEVESLRAQLEQLRAELADERYRHDRYVDYAVERDRMMDQMKEDLRQSGRSDPCDYCKHKGEQLNCEGADFLCDLCLHGECRCHDCRDFSNWEWRGIG